MVAHTDWPSNTRIYADTIVALYQKISTNDMSPYIRKIFNRSYLFRLHKDPTNPLKLLPIVVGGSLMRAFTSYIVRNNTPLLTNYLLPYNFAIGIRGGHILYLP